MRIELPTPHPKFQKKNRPFFWEEPVMNHPYYKDTVIFLIDTRFCVKESRLRQAGGPG